MRCCCALAYIDNVISAQDPTLHDNSYRSLNPESFLECSLHDTILKLLFHLQSVHRNTVWSIDSSSRLNASGEQVWEMLSCFRRYTECLSDIVFKICLRFSFGMLLSLFYFVAIGYIWFACYGTWFWCLSKSGKCAYFGCLLFFYMFFYLSIMLRIIFAFRIFWITDVIL